MKNKKINKPKLAPIVPKGEFAKLFGPLMIEYRIEEVNRDNFFNTFIQAIEGKNYESRNDLKKFKDVLISHSLTYKQKETLRNITPTEKKNETEKCKTILSSDVNAPSVRACFHLTAFYSG
jgi:hypothetical protein